MVSNGAQWQVDWLTLESRNLNVPSNWEVAKTISGRSSVFLNSIQYIPFHRVRHKNISIHRFSLLLTTHARTHILFHKRSSFSSQGCYQYCECYLGASIVLPEWGDYGINPKFSIILAASRSILLIFAIFSFKSERKITLQNLIFFA